MRFSSLRLCILVLASLPVQAQLPPPPQDFAPFPLDFSPASPGQLAVTLDKPAGRLGPVIVRGDHFYTGDRRIKFWGVNFAFSACFPTHEQADRVATRLSRFGVNAVRLHHMDMQKFPNGIFADDKLDTLSREALDRLDYLVGALKREGVYVNINLHVSRSYARAHRWPNVDRLPETMDKTIDLFHPDLIAVEKQYARDLLTHVNAYTRQPYTAEPAVCMVEINNENTLFTWGGEDRLANLPDPYASILQQKWNDWILNKYKDKTALAAAWNIGAEPLGPNVIRDPGLASLNQNGTPYTIEQHDQARMTLTRIDSAHIPLAKFDVTKTDGTSWHLQFGQGKLQLKKGQFYTLSFRCRTEGPKQITVGISQAHPPYQNLGLSASVKLYPQDTDQYYGFTASADDDNARVSFSVGWEQGTFYLGNLTLRTGGQTGLDALNEDPAKGTVARRAPRSSWTAARSIDWYDFLQQADEAYFTDFRNYLKDDLKLQAPVTGTIALGPLGAITQSRMDFVDAHAYWDHPDFPNHDWSPRNWTIKNKPMVDDPAGSPLWQLAANRVAGKPFTVTEYNHSAPDEWQAEGLPIIATYATLQDWDAIYLFAYSHNNQFEKDYAASYFDVEGNWLKMAAMPLASRLFRESTITPAGELTRPLRRQDILPVASASFFDTWRYLRAATPATDWPALLDHRFAIRFDSPTEPAPPAEQGSPITWTASTPGTGRYTVSASSAAAFVGFNKGTFPVPLSEGVTLTNLDTPFASILLIPSDPTKSIRDADRLLLGALARAQNTGEHWNDARTSLSTNWGQSPPQIEPVHATLALPHDYTVHPLDPAGQPLNESSTSHQTLQLGDTPTLWYELIRR